MMRRVLLLLPTTTYRSSDFLAAARRLGVEVTAASEEPNALEALNPHALITLDFRDPEACVRRALELDRAVKIDAVVPVDEDTSVAAAAISEALGLPHNTPEAAAAARHKPTMRALLADAGVPSPAHRVFRIGDDPLLAASEPDYPCVLKPTFLAGSRGVIRADDAASFVRAWRRIVGILEEREVADRDGSAAREILVEDFVPGREVALEGLLRDGQLLVLALFDKPDPLDGPFFEETIYVTPSRLPEADQERIAGVGAEAARALGLSDGPIHAELRVGPDGVRVIEVAARSIGGLCARTLRFGTGMSLEEVILRHALRLPFDERREARAAGVMMIPVPKRGVLQAVRGVEEAKAVRGVEDVAITIHSGQPVVPLPEGSRYLGFIFSRANTPEAAEAALREAHAKLEFDIRG